MLSNIPYYTLYAPLYWATSSPIKNTFESLDNSSSKAEFKASRTVIWMGAFAASAE